MRKARLIYNPVSGKEIMRNNLADILEAIEQAGYEASAFATTPEPDSAKNEATRAAKAGFELVVAAGGDGTINEVVNGIAGLKKRPKMAIIPAGTTNDYARALKSHAITSKQLLRSFRNNKQSRWISVKLQIRTLSTSRLVVR